MNKDIIRTQIRELLETINEEVEATHTYPEKIPRIEFDILLENIRRLYESMLLLQRMNELQSQAGTPRPHRPPNAPPPPSPAPEPVRSAAPPKPKEKSESEEFTGQPVKPLIMGVDLFGTPEPDKSLKAMITINEKFIFINELFDGNLREYNESVETLNGFKDLREALEFLDLLRRKNMWDASAKPFGMMKDLLERRFAI